MAKFIVEIPDETVLEDYDTNVDVMDAIADLLQDVFPGVKVREMF